VLERRVITRVGGTAEIAVDVRVVCATHRDLDAEVRAGRFRQDLLYRIAGFTIDGAAAARSTTRDHAARRAVRAPRRRAWAGRRRRSPTTPAPR
jgi:transcriptional regulator of acetoin/glycerol metabolism